MRIRRVEAFLLSCPLDPVVTMSYYGGRRTIVKRDAMIVRVEADNGLIGYGPGPAHEGALQRIRTVVAPFLEGRELREPDAVRILFSMSPGVTPADLRYYAAVEIALFDLTAKSYGVPVSDLLGGRVRDEIRLYASAGMYMPAGGYLREAEAAADLGFHAYKFRPGLGPDADRDLVHQLRDKLDPVFDLMVDAHTWWRMGRRNYSADEVRELAAEFGRLGVCWLEEPFPPHDHEALARLKDEDLVPLATGEHEPDEAGYSDLIALRAADILQMDLVCQGGYAAGRRLLLDIHRAGLSFAFHCWGTDLEVAAAAQLGICHTDETASWLEYPLYRDDETPVMYPFPAAREVLKEPLPIRRGRLYLDSSLPGLGVEVDMDVVNRYPWIPGPWSFFYIDDPAETRAVIGDHSVSWAP